ncbi:MAG: amidohydrolase family protein, partial [Chloroflexi bacterium CFX2]|nr:amidohydrolase family protein [Chloroflexi bacterium CFX2]
MSSILIRNGTLIDGTGKAPLADAAVLVKDNLILDVGQGRNIRQPDTEVTEIDAGGGYILPGMIDTHVHVMLEGVNIARDMVTPFSMRFYNSVKYLKNTIDAGITSVRDAGGADAGVKQAVESGVIVGPRLQISISVLTITGGHGDGWMRSGMEYDLFMPYPGFPSCRV